MFKETGAAPRHAGGAGDDAAAAAKELPQPCTALLGAAASDREEEPDQLVPTPPPRPLAVLMPDEDLRETDCTPHLPAPPTSEDHVEIEDGYEEAMVRPLVGGFAELQLTIQASELSPSSMHRFSQLVIQGGDFLQRHGHLFERPEVPDGAVCGPNLHRIGSAVSTGTTTGIGHLGGVMRGVGKLAQAASFSMENPLAKKLVRPRQPPAASDVASK